MTLLVQMWALSTDDVLFLIYIQVCIPAKPATNFRRLYQKWQADMIYQMVIENLQEALTRFFSRLSRSHGDESDASCIRD